MNKRQAKKKEKLFQLSMEWGFDHFPKYREIKEIERGYKEYYIKVNRHGSWIGKSLIGSIYDC